LLLWARNFEALSRRTRPPDRTAGRRRRRALALRWRKAAAALEQLGRGREARDCWVRSLRLHPWDHRVWSGILRGLWGA
jgi:hypothetical protein